MGSNRTLPLFLPHSVIMPTVLLNTAIPPLFLLLKAARVLQQERALERKCRGCLLLPLTLTHEEQETKSMRHLHQLQHQHPHPQCQHQCQQQQQAKEEERALVKVVNGNQRKVLEAIESCGKTSDNQVLWGCREGRRWCGHWERRL